jgi:hypothetical protein
MSLTETATSNGAVIFKDHEACALDKDIPPTTHKLNNIRKIDFPILMHLRFLNKNLSFHPSILVVYF